MEVSCSLRAAMSCFILPASSKSVLLASSSSLFLAGPVFPCVRLASRRAVPVPRRPRGCRCLFGLGVPELVVIAGVAALVFGPKKLPEIGKSIGKTVRSFQQAAKEFETELKKEPSETEIAESLTAEKPKATVTADEKKEFEASGTKESG